MAQVSEIRRQIAGVPGVIQVSPDGAPAAAVDPFQASILQHRQLMAQTLEQRTAAQLQATMEVEEKRANAEALKLELDAAKSEAQLLMVRRELAQAREDGQARANGEGGVLAAMIQSLAEDRRQLTEQLHAVHQAQMAQMAAQLEESRRPQPAAPSPLLGVAEQASQMKALLELMEELRPRPPAIPSGLSGHEQIELKRFELEAQTTLHELNEKAALRLRELQNRERYQDTELDLRRRQLAAEQDRANKLGDLVEQVAPGVVEMFSRRLLGDGGEAAAGGPADEAGAPEVPQIGVRCNNCGTAFPVAEGTEMAVCPSCHLMLRIGQPPPG